MKLCLARKKNVYLVHTKPWEWLSAPHTHIKDIAMPGLPGLAGGDREIKRSSEFILIPEQILGQPEQHGNLQTNITIY